VRAWIEIRCRCPCLLVHPGETSETVWTSGNDVKDVMRLAKRVNEGSYIVKDYVESRKHELYYACFIRNIKDEAIVKKWSVTL